jgi:hypothetical protein
MNDKTKRIGLVVIVFVVTFVATTSAMLATSTPHVPCTYATGDQIDACKAKDGLKPTPAPGLPFPVKVIEQH